MYLTMKRRVPRAFVKPVSKFFEKVIANNDAIPIPRRIAFEKLPKSFVCGTLGVLIILLFVIDMVHADERLLIRAEIDGKPSSLFEKVVVTSAKASISKEPTGAGEPIEPFAIFFKLKTDSGQKEQNGYVRVGKSSGEPVGWIKKEDVTEWNTRFILEPTQPVPGKAFSVDLGGGNSAELKVVPSGKRRFALVTSSSEAKDANDDPKYQVVVYAGSVQTVGTGGTLARERNEIRDLKLEIVFVLESTDFMLDTFDGVNVGDSVKNILNQSVEAIQKNDALKGAVKLGIIEYQDTTQKAKFVSRITCPLTDDANVFLSSIDKIAPFAIEGDFPEDAIAGLYKAVTDAGWSENSSKHIILLGSGSCQLLPKGHGRSQFGGTWNSATKPGTDDGWNSTGLSVAQLVSRAHPQGGSGEQRARNAKTFHTVLTGQKLPPLSAEIVDTLEKVVKSDDVVLSSLVEGGVSIDTLRLAFQYYLFKYHRELASEQYRELARNDGVQGLALVVEPNASDIRNASEEISRTLVQSFSTLAGVRSGGIGLAQLEGNGNSNSISQTFYAIVGAAADKFKDLPTLAGSASTRDERGREVALRKVLVSQSELQRLRSTLDAIHKKFQARIAKVDRQDVTQILDDLKQLAAQTTAGQRQFAADVQLKDVITDLPLRTTALETTPRDLAVMPSDTFKQWLNKLEASIFRADDLINGKAEWLELSSKAENEKFTFLQVSELP